jgi:ubiquitin-protein ligase
MRALSRPRGLPHPPGAQALRESDAADPAILAKAHSILASKCNFPPTQLDALAAVTQQLQQPQAAGGAADVAQAFAHVEAAEAAEPTPALLKRLEASYVAAQRPLAFDEAEMEGPSSYEHYYKQNIADSPAAGIPRAKMRRLAQELKKMAEEGVLPVSAESAIYLLKDEGRADVLKVLISGPADVLKPEQAETPYALGLFEFHIFVPQDYPNVSPLVNLQTTGDGLVRFNPNLYSDGKVCLSLLGTWHGEGWVAPSDSNSGSTILQVLLSIQSIIMVPQPYFNEPGYEGDKGTPAGDQRSREYNDNIRAATLRHAVRDMLRRPPAGFEEIVRSHFRLLRPLLERQIRRWVAEAQTESTREGMLRTYAELRPLLDQLDAAEGGDASAAAAAAEGAPSAAAP